MCSISVEPIPSTISSPNVLCHRRSTSGANGSAAERHIRTEPRSYAEASSRFTIAPYSVGTEKKSDGWVRCAVSMIGRGCGRPGSSTVEAPTQYGNDMLLPMPYAW